MPSKIAFWGIGRMANRILTFCEQFGCLPDYLLDSDESIAGKDVYGLTVHQPQAVLTREKVRIFVTCNKVKEIQDLVNGEGMEAFDGRSVFKILDAIPEWRDRVARKYANDFGIGSTVYFGVDMGLVMGGVESWSIDVGKTLKEMGNPVKFMIPSGSTIFLMVDPDELFQYKKDSNPVGSMIEMFSVCKPNAIVINFPGFVYDAACIAKMIWPKTHIIGVIHNDEKEYYDAYTEAEPYLDYCLTISEKQYREMERKQFPSHKLKRMEWSVPFREKEHVYSTEKEPIRIGYAGRIVIAQKRVDRLIELAEYLIADEIPFVLNIAGDGEYSEKLKSVITRRGYDPYMKTLGAIPREKMEEFWLKQDVYVSCSEWEGRSISKAEAMAAGVVPVITDTSGASDDINNGVNGYIVPVGDIRGIADRIKELFFHRDRLSLFGNRAKEVVRKNNESFEEETFWRELLGMT